MTLVTLAAAPKTLQYVSKDGEIDMAKLHACIAEINQEIEAKQEEVSAVVEVHHPEFVRVSQNMDELKRDIERIAGGLIDIEDLISKKDGESKDSKFSSSVREYEAARGEVAALKRQVTYLQSLLKLDLLFAMFDQHFKDCQYAKAGVDILDLCQLLSSLCAKDPDEEPELITNLKTEYLTRRALLLERCDDLLGRFFEFGNGYMTVQTQIDRVFGQLEVPGQPGSVTRMPDLWDALDRLQILAPKLTVLSKWIQKFVVAPLIAAAAKLDDGANTLEAKVTTNGAAVTWTFITGRVKKGNGSGPDADGGQQTKPLREPAQGHSAACSLLLSFFEFWTEHVALGMSHSDEVKRRLGRLLYPHLTQKLTRSLPLTTSSSCDAVCAFEAKAKEGGFLGEEDTKLALLAAKHKHTLQDRRKEQILSEVREWLMSDDRAVVYVSDQTEIGSLSNLRHAGGCKLKNQVGQSSAASSSGKTNTNANASANGDRERDSRKKLLLAEKLATRFGEVAADVAAGRVRVDDVVDAAMDDTEGFLRLPKCGVSIACHKLVARMHSLLDEAIQRAKRKDVSTARELQHMVRQLVTLFLMVGPTFHQARLTNEPFFQGLFFSDCTYLAHHLTTMPFTYSGKFPDPLNKFGTYVDLVVALRRVQEAYFLQFLRNQKTQLLQYLSGGINHVSLDRNYAQVETNIAAAVQHLKNVAASWRRILPLQAYLEGLALLVDIFVSDLSNQVLGLRDSASRQDVAALAHLLASAHAQLVPLLEAHKIPQAASQRSGDSLDGGGEGDKEEAGAPEWGAGGSVEAYVSGMERFCLIKELIDADFSVFLERKALVLQSFSPAQLRALLALNPHGSRTPDEALRTLLH